MRWPGETPETCRILELAMSARGNHCGVMRAAARARAQVVELVARWGCGTRNRCPSAPWRRVQRRWCQPLSCCHNSISASPKVSWPRRGQVCRFRARAGSGDHGVAGVAAKAPQIMRLAGMGLVEFDHGLTERRHIKMFFHAQAYRTSRGALIGSPASHLKSSSTFIACDRSAASAKARPASR